MYVSKQDDTGMKIVIAPNSFKESLFAREIAAQIEAGFHEVYPDAEYVKVPAADGGEGTVGNSEWWADLPPASDWSPGRAGRCVLWPVR